MEDQSERVQKLKQEKSQLEQEVEQLMREKGWKEPEKVTGKILIRIQISLISIY